MTALVQASEPTRIQWQAQPTEALGALAQAWCVVDFFQAAPAHLQGSLLLALTRRKALVVAFTDGRHMLLIHFRDAAAVWLNGDGQQRCEAVQRVRCDNTWLMAFMPVGSAAALHTLTPAPLTLSMAACGHIDVYVGEHTRISCLPASRSWDWAWAPSLGPLYLSIYLERAPAREQILAWLQKNLPSGYTYDAKQIYATRNARPEHTLRHTDQIWCCDGELHFVHGYYRHVEPLDNARAVFLLRKLASAELGPLSFDLFDGDYGTLCASGYSGASLHYYLDTTPSYDRKKPHPWNTLRHLEIHVPEQINVDEHIRTALNHALDLPADAPFGAALAQPLAELPRWITVHLPPGGEGFERSLHDPGNSNFRRIHWCTQRPNFGT